MKPKQTNTPSDEALYAECMERIKRRTTVIAEFLAKSRSTGYMITDVEFLALQFRKVLEGIALASICAHRQDYERIREDFGKDWNARLITSDIQRVNPDFYPTPIENDDVIDSTTGIPRWVEKTTGFLTKKQFLRFYERSAAILHEQNPYSRSAIDIENLRTEFLEWHALKKAAAVE